MPYITVPVRPSGEGWPLRWLWMPVDDRQLGDPRSSGVVVSIDRRRAEQGSEGGCTVVGGKQSLYGSIARAARQCALVGAIGLLVLPASSLGQSAHFDIASQPLPAALHVFAIQAQMQLLYEHTAVAGVIGDAVSGDIDKRAALEQLLRGTGLEIIYTSDHAATIRRPRVSGEISPRQHRDVQPDGNWKDEGDRVSRESTSSEPGLRALPGEARRSSSR